VALEPAKSARSRARRLLVGRERERDELLGALAGAEAGRGTLFLLSGEAGIGKTTLADELEQRARERGFCCAWGRVWQAGGAPAFWPFSEALAQIARELSPDAPPVTFGRVGTDAANPEQARFELFSSVRAFLTSAARQKPLLLILDDLHGADQSSLLLLQFLARDVRGLPIVLLGTFRDPEARLETQSGALIAQISREGRSLPLGRLADGEASALVQAVAPDLDPRHAATVLGTGQGNPLFLDEMLRLCLADPARFDGRSRTVPHGVREVIRQRLALLSDAARAALDAAAVVGDEFEPWLLASVTNIAASELEDVLESAVAADVLVEQPGRRYRFGHAMFRDALYRDLPPSRRRALHALLLGVLEQRQTQASHASLAELAHHALEAAPEGLQHAVALALDAAQDAVLRVAYDDALALFERTRKLLESLALEPALLGEVLLGEALLRIRLGQQGVGRERCQAALEIARRLSSPSLLARAALTYGAEFTVGVVDPYLVELLREALALLAAGEPALRARVLARLAAALQPCRESQVPVTMAREAIALARGLGDEVVLLEVLFSSLSAMMDFVVAPERIPLNREVAALAAKLGDKPKQLRTFGRQVLDHMELGEFAAAAPYIDSYESLARALDLPHYLFRVPLFRAMQCLAEGRFERAAELRDLAAAYLAGHESAQARRALLAHHHGALRVMERLDELVPLLELEAMSSLEGIPEAAGNAAALQALVAARREDAQETRRWHSRVPLTGWFWFGDPMAVMMLAEPAALLAEREQCAGLYEHLTFASGVDITLGLFGLIWDGPVDRVLGILAAALDRHEDAARHFEAALQRLERLNAKPYLARTRYEYARALLAAGRDRGRALELLESAAALAAEVGLPTLERLIAARRGPTSVAPGAPPFSITLEGEFWTLSWEGPPVRLKDSRGQQILARLLAEPEREFHVRDLAGAAGSEAADVGDGGELLDEQARKQYGQRLTELRAEQEEAESFGDRGRAARAREELEFLTAELARAVGLGGRARRAGSASERARVAVQRRIRDAIQRIEANAPAVGQHLAATVHTGSFCVYRPSAPRPGRR
jgi:tetratricopeptide (TPR) repeat protein